MKKSIYITNTSTYEAPLVELVITRVEGGFGNSLGLGDLETEEGELYY